MSLETLGAVAATSLGTDLTAHASAHTKGDYTELSASIAAACDGFVFERGRPSVGNTGFLIDVATGAALSETVRVANTAYDQGASGRLTDISSVPLGIAVSTRVAARCQATVGGRTVAVLLYLWAIGDTHPWGCTAVDTYGADTSDTGGTSIDPGGTANTKPATFTDIAASTSAAIEQVGLCFPNQLNTVRSNFDWLADFATGAAASEVVQIADISLTSSTLNDLVVPPFFPFVPLAIPVSTRLSMRAQCSGTDATDRLFDVIVYGARGADAIEGGTGGGGMLVHPGMSGGFHG